MKLNYLPSEYPSTGTGPAVAETNVNFYIYGQVLATDDANGDSSYIKGNVFVEIDGSVTAMVNANDSLGLGSTPPPSLVITGPILDEAIINMGQAGVGTWTPGWLQTNGTVTIDVAALVTLYPDSDWQLATLVSGGIKPCGVVAPAVAAARNTTSGGESSAEFKMSLDGMTHTETPMRDWDGPELASEDPGREQLVLR